MDFTREDKQKISSSIREKYQKVAQSPEGQFRYPTGREGLDKQAYGLDILDKLPTEVLATFVGVGNPLSLGRPVPGEKVLDIGCGAGVDTLIASHMVMPEGEVTGLDYSSEMIARAKQNQALCGVTNAKFLQGSAEELPLDDGQFDLVISNGAFNLIVEKEHALAEVFRVLKTGGRLQIADQMLVGAPPSDHKAKVASWFT